MKHFRRIYTYIYHTYIYQDIERKNVCGLKKKKKILCECVCLCVWKVVMQEDRSQEEEPGSGAGLT